ncbi:MAG: stage II sporulation protein M [Panacagrimonas sp.]
MSQLRAWIDARRGHWAALEDSERRLRARGLTAAEAQALTEGYRHLAADLSTARTLLPGSTLAQHLASFYARLHLRLHQPWAPWRERLARLYLEELPAAALRMRPQLAAVGGLFLLFALAGLTLVSLYPELASLVASEEMIDGAARGELWTDHVFGVVPASVASVGIAANNISVSFMAWLLGSFYGLGTLYIIGLNGLMLGGTFAFVHQHGLAPRLFDFVAAHGFAELSIIVIAGAAGARIGQAFARPGRSNRADAFREAVADTGRIFALLAPALVVCGLVEGYLSPDPACPTVARVVIGLCLALLLWLALLGRLRISALRRATGGRRVNGGI